jgi:hypothetical protein
VAATTRSRAAALGYQTTPSDSPPYDLYGVECAPADGSSLPLALAPDFGKPILIEHYGPVKWVDFLGGSSQPFEAYEISAQPLCGGSWVAVTDCFEVTSPESQNPADVFTTVYAEPTDTLSNGVRFRFIHPEEGVTGGLSSVVADQQIGPRVPSYEYGFTVGTDCPGDINGDNRTDGADLSILLANFSAPMRCFLEGDYNLNRDVEGADLSVLLANWNRDCAGGNGCGALPSTMVDADPFESSRSTLNPGSPPSVDEPEQVRREASEAPASSPSADGLAIINAFGYTSFDAYGAWVNTMSPAEFANHAEVLLGVIAELDAGE